MLQIKLNHKIWLSNAKGENIIGDGKWMLLNAIHSSGSIADAAKQTGMSYRKAWGEIRKMEEALNTTVVVKKRGGTNGGNTHLSEDGIKIINCFENMKKEINLKAQDSFNEFLKELKE